MSKSKEGRRNERAGAGCLTALGALWMVMVFAIDGVALSGFYHLTYAKSNYVQTNATITQSSIQSHTSSDGTTYSADIEYAYTAGGTEYTSDRHSFFRISTSSRDLAQQTANKYPLGTQVVAYYDPAKPEDAVIELDDTSFPYSVILFLTPFHCIGIGLLYAGISMTRRKKKDPHAAQITGYIIKNRGRTLVLHDAFWPSWLVFLIMLGITNFVAVFVVLLGIGFAAPKSTILPIWMLCVGVSWCVACFKHLKRSRSHNRLTINWAEGWFVRGRSLTRIPIAHIKKIKLESAGTNKKAKRQEWYKHTIEAIDLNDQPHTLLIGKGQKHRGKELRSWFEIEFGLKEPAASKESTDASTPAE